MYGSTSRLNSLNNIPQSSNAAAADTEPPADGGEDDVFTPLLRETQQQQQQQHPRPSPHKEQSSSALRMPPPNYDPDRRRQDFRQMQMQSSSSRQRRRSFSSMRLGPTLPRGASTAVLKNIVREGHQASSANNNTSARHLRPNPEHRAKRSKQQSTPLAESSTTTSTLQQRNQKTLRHRNNRQQQQPAAAESSKRKKHSFLYSMLNPHSRRWQANIYKTLITTIITSDLFVYIASTDERARTRFPHLFTTWEAAISYIFLLEYTARLYVVIEKPKYASPITGRLQYALGSASAWIDLLAAAPYFIEQITGWSLPTLTVLRLFRLVRILQTQSYMRALDAVYRVVYYNAEILYVAALICVFLTVSTALLLYLLRPEHDDEHDFGSLAATLYLSTLLLTGQGGPGGDLPWYTKSVVLLTSVFSVAIFAIPASMLTWGFEAEAERVATAAYRKATAAAAHKNQNNPTTSDDTNSSSSSTSEGNTTDDEYFKLLGGGDDDDDDQSSTEEAPWIKEIRQSFEQADVNRDGTLSLPELIELMTRKHIMEQQQLPQASSLEEWTTRLDTLEAKVHDTNEKLDRILDLLQPST